MSYKNDLNFDYVKKKVTIMKAARNNKYAITCFSNVKAETQADSI